MTPDPGDLAQKEKKGGNNNIAWFEIVTIVFIFLAGIALARAEISLRDAGANKIAIATLKANYSNIKESLDRLEGKIDKFLERDR